MLLRRADLYVMESAVSTPTQRIVAILALMIVSMRAHAQANPSVHSVPQRAEESVSSPVQSGTEISLDVLLGAGKGIAKASLEKHVGIATAAALSLLAGASSQPIVISLAAEYEGIGPEGDRCRRTDPSGPCLSNPRMRSLAVRIGREWSGSNRAARLTVGPGGYIGDANQRALGVQFQGDFELTRGRGLALLAWINGALLPNYFGSRYGTLGLGVGVRVR